MKKVFVSHSTKDKVIADSFVDIILHGGLSVPIPDILHTSMNGTKIKSGEDWRKAVRDTIANSKLIFLLISPHYKESEVCICEMGASWITSNKVLPLIIDPINYKTVGVIHAPNQVEKLIEEESLDRIRDIVQEELNIANALIPSDRWTTKKTEFIQKIKNHLSGNLYPIPVDRTTFDELHKQKSDLEKTIQSLIKEKSEASLLIEQLKNAKDKSEVLNIMKGSSPSTDYETFNELAQDVKKLMKRYNPLVSGIIFRSYTGKAIKISTYNNEDALSSAIADNYIDEEELEVKWDSTRKMKELKASLDKLDRFMIREFSPDFYQAYEEDFRADFDMSTKKFWEEVFDANISFG